MRDVKPVRQSCVELDCAPKVVGWILDQGLLVEVFQERIPNYSQTITYETGRCLSDVTTHASTAVSVPIFCVVLNPRSP